MRPTKAQSKQQTSPCGNPAANLALVGKGISRTQAGLFYKRKGNKMQTKKTKSGVVVTLTHRVHGCLEQGGYCGRQVLVRYSSIGMPPSAGLNTVINPHGTTWAELATDYAQNHDPRCCGDKVLRRGEVVR